MSDTAHDYQTFQPAKTEGFEDLFVEVATPIGTVAGPSRDDDMDRSCLVTALEAAEILGINKRSVIRLINEQKLDAIKQDGKYLVDRDAVERRRRDARKIAKSRTDVLLDIEVPGPSRDEAAPIEVSLENEDAGQAHDEGPVGQIESMSTNTIDAFQLLKELEGATFRIGYLEAQLAERDNQIKLLTDTHHKSSWWAGFKKWFLGR